MPTEEAPWKRCAVCEQRIPWRSKLCSQCFELWGEALKRCEPWILCLVEWARQDFNLRRQLFRYERSLEGLLERTQQENDDNDHDSSNY